MRKIAADEPLWYGRDGEQPFNYEDSEWHQRHVRFSDEIKDDEGGSHTLNDSSNGSSPTQVGGSDIGKALSSDEDEEKPRIPFGVPGETTEEDDEVDAAAPSPVISRTSRDRASRDREARPRSAGWGH